MTTSEQINELAAALAKAQAAFGPVKKERTARINSAKGNYSYRYADLSDVLDSVRKSLAANGLAIVQPITWTDGHAWLATRLIHSSGQWIESVYPLGNYDRPQEMGSAITYARRYTLTALLGIAADEDDDGNTAQDSEQPRSHSQRLVPRIPSMDSPVMKSPTALASECLRLSASQAAAEDLFARVTLGLRASKDLKQEDTPAAWSRLVDLYQSS